MSRRRLSRLAGQPHIPVIEPAPGAPTSVIVSALSSTAILASWTAPATGGAPTDYEVQYSLNGSTGWTTFSDGTSTSTFATVTGLSASTTYYVRVRGSNISGNGEWSAVGSGATSAPVAPPGDYGATADDGTTWDVTVEAAAYAGGTTYAWGDMVSDAGVYYVSLVDGNVGNAVTSPTHWRRISQFMYVDSVSGNDGTGVVSTNPATAKASPFQNLSAVSARITNGNGGTRMEPNAMVCLKRDGTYIGNLYSNHIRTSQGITSLSGDGATVTATTPAAHNLVTGVTVTISGATPAGYNASAVVTVTSPTTFTYANTTTGASSGTIVFSSFYGNFYFGNYGTGALPILKYSDNATISAGSMIATNRTGVMVRGLDVTGENLLRVVVTSLVGTFQAGETITGGTSGASATVVRVGTSTRLMVTMNSGTFSGTETITGGTSGATGTYSSGSSGVPVGIEVRDYAHIRDCKVHGWNTNGILLGVAATANSSQYTQVINNFVYNNGNTRDFNGAGIDQGVGAGMRIQNNSIYDNGYPGATQNHQVYMGTSGGATVTDFVISGNDIYCTANYGNHAIVLHGNFTTTTIQDNRMDSCGNGLAINGGYSSAESFDGFTIQRNVITNCGMLPTQGQGYAMLLDCLTNSTIVNNLIAGNKLGAINLNVSASGGSDTVMNTVSILHNTIDCPSTSYYCIYMAGAIQAITIRNNILSTLADAANEYAIQKASTTSDAQITLNNNLYYAPSKGAGALFSWDGSDRSLAYVQGTLSKEAAGTSGNPLYVSGSDYNLQGGSPARNLGANLGVTTDILGNARDTSPHAGCYESA